jgi:glucokinase
VSVQAIGLDLGGTQIKAVLITGDGEVLRREVRDTGDGAGAMSWAEAMKGLACDFGPDLPVGISAPGLIARDGRSVAFMPGRLQGLEGLDWPNFMERNAPVTVSNDAHASLCGEAWIGAARSLRDCFMLTLGTGVGGAIMSDGRLLKGHLGRAGHLGHITLDIYGLPDIVRTPGSLEDFVGNHNIQKRTWGRFTTTHALVAAYRDGDPTATRLWNSTIRGLAVGIASLINVLDPEAVIIGGGITNAGDALFAPLQRELDQVEWQPGGHKVRIIPAELGEWAGAVGAARGVLPMSDPADPSRFTA